MDDELKEAIAELAEFYDFYMSISELPAEEMVERVEERDPSFIEHIETMEEPPKTTLDFWSGFGIWTISGLRSKYHHIWDRVIDTYFRSGTNRQLYEKYKLKDAVWSQINKILKNSGF